MLNQHKFEFDIYHCLTFGDEKKIANKAGKGQSYYAQMFSPDDPRESLFYRAARDFINWSEVNHEDAAKAFAVFCAAVSAGMKRESTGLCHQTEACNTLKEAHDVAAVSIHGGTLGDKLREAYELRHQADRNIQAILDAMKPASTNGHAIIGRGEEYREVSKHAINARNR